MGTVMQRLVKLGEYCDCLQNWQKYNDEPQQISNNSFISENLSNIQLPLQKVFHPQIVENGFDKQLQIMHQRLNKRKRLKAEYIKQRQQQRILEQKQQERMKKQRIQKIESEKQLMIREEQLRRFKQEEAQKLRKQKRSKKIIANKRNRKLRDRQKAKLDDLQLLVVNRELSTTDQNILNPADNNSNTEEEQQQNFCENQQEQEQEKNQKKKYQKEQSQQKESDDFDYEIKSQNYFKQKQKDKGLDIIDLSKLDPNSMKDQISELVLKKLNFKVDEKINSKTVPLNLMSIQSHRTIGDSKDKNMSRKGHLQYQDKRPYQFDQDEIQFRENQINNKRNENYFLDDDDKQEYFRKND